MAAYNWIAIQAVCPVCGRESGIRCQTHVASDFDGDDEGRFCHREYRLGERMRWWEPGHGRHAEWRVQGRTSLPALAADCDEEACYSECISCGAQLCVVIEFLSLVPERVIAIVREEDWPAGYQR